MSSPFKSQRGFRRILRAAGYSWQGLKAAYSHEAAFRQELWLCVILVPCAIWVAQSLGQFLLLIASLLFVLTMELINSAIEALADSISQEFHPLLGRAKDIGSAAVLLSFMVAACAWLAVLYTNYFSTGLGS